MTSVMTSRLHGLVAVPPPGLLLPQDGEVNVRQRVSIGTVEGGLPEMDVDGLYLLSVPGSGFFCQDFHLIFEGGDRIDKVAGTLLVLAERRLAVMLVN